MTAVYPGTETDAHAEADLATHAGLKRNVHGIPASVGSGQALVGDGSGGFTTLTPASLSSGGRVPYAQLPDQLLRWAPPQLSNATIVAIDGSTDWYPLTNGKDYILVCSPNAVRPSGSSGIAQVIGGRNILMIGGELDISGGSTAKNESAGRVLYFQGQTGVIHLEGLYIHGTNLTEGIVFYSPQAVARIQNVRIDGLGPDNGSIHPDLISYGSGVRELQVDRFTGSTAYQGITLLNTGGTVQGPATIRRTNLKALTGSAQTAQLLWVGRQDIPLTLDDFYIEPRSDQILANSVHPSNSDADTALRPISDTDGGVHWGPKAGIAGRVGLGPPPTGDFVAASTGAGGFDVPGYNYVSPGYQAFPVSTTEPSVVAATSQTANYTLDLPDAGTVLEINSGSAVTVTVPPDSTSLFPVGCTIEIFRQGAGTVTIAQGAGVTLPNIVEAAGTTNRTIAHQCGTVTLRKRAANVWALSGDVA